MRKTIKYCLQSAQEYGITIHPEYQMNLLGIKIIKWRAETIASAIFMVVENLPETLPPYITLSNYKFD